MAQDASRASDTVEQSVFVLASELFACLLLLIDDLGCGGDEFIDNCVLAETQSDLVGNLIETACGAGTLAVRTAHGEALTTGCISQRSSHIGFPTASFSSNDAILMISDPIAIA